MIYISYFLKKFIVCVNYFLKISLIEKGIMNTIGMCFYDSYNFYIAKHFMQNWYIDSQHINLFMGVYKCWLVYGILFVFY